MYCEKCGAQLDDNAVFCTSCGAKIEEIEQPTAENNEIAENTEIYGAEISDGAVKKSPLKKVIIGIVAVCAAVAVCFVGFKLVTGMLGGDSDYTKHPLIYEKDGELQLLRYGKSEAYCLSDRGDDIDYYRSLVQVTDDGKTVFFAHDYDDGEFKLYYRKTSQKTLKGRNADSTGIKIASGVTGFDIEPDGKFVVYLRDDRLYWTDLKKERTISSDVDGYWLSDDSKVIVYGKGDDLYTCRADYNSDPEKVDSDVSNVVSLYGEYKTIYYIKDEALYKKPYGKDKVKLSNDVASASIIDDTVFVAKTDEIKRGFDDLFYDDCAQSDAELTEPEYEDFREESEDSFFGYVTDYDAYYEAREEYGAKEERDEIREYYNDNPQTLTTYTIYKIDGNSEVKIGEGFNNYDFYGRILRKNNFDDNSGKIKLSEIESMYDARRKVNELSDDENTKTEKYFLKSDGKLIDITDTVDEDTYDFYVSLDEKYLYCIEDESEKTAAGTLNRYTIGASSLNNKTKIHDDVCDMDEYDEFIVIECDDEWGVYSSGKYHRVSDNEVSRQFVSDGILYYFEDYDYEKGFGDFYMYKNGKTKRIDTDVADWSVRTEKLMYYIKDYSSKRRCGDLYINKGGKTKRLDTDVTRIVY